MCLINSDQISAYFSDGALGCSCHYRFSLRRENGPIREHEEDLMSQSVHRSCVETEGERNYPSWSHSKSSHRLISKHTDVLFQSTDVTMKKEYSCHVCSLANWSSHFFWVSIWSENDKTNDPNTCFLTLTKKRREWIVCIIKKQSSEKCSSLCSAQTPWTKSRAHRPQSWSSLAKLEG